jgi:hypothetical protein
MGSRSQIILSQMTEQLDFLGFLGLALDSIAVVKDSEFWVVYQFEK